MRDTPEYVDSPSLAVLLENQNAGAFRILRIVFHDHARHDAGNDLFHKYTISGQFIIPMIRNTYCFVANEFTYKLKRLATHVMIVPDSCGSGQIG